MNGHTELIIMLKAPLLGHVKTRLAAGLGEAGALAAYRRLVETMTTNLQLSELPATICFTPHSSEASVREWLGGDFHYEAQVEGDLGQRLARATGNAFQRGRQQVLVIGSDCPEVEPRDLEVAAENLATSEVVIGPARDGGYWLIGLRQPRPELFADIEWSTERVFEQTLKQAARLGLKTEILRTLSDVDTLAEWRAFCEGRQTRAE